MIHQHQFKAIPTYVKASVLVISATAGIASFVLSLSILMAQGTSGVEVVSNTLFCVAAELTKIVSGFLFALAGLMGWQNARRITMTVFICCACFSIWLSFAFFKNQDHLGNMAALTGDAKFRDLQGMAGDIDGQLGQKQEVVAALSADLAALDPKLQPGNHRQVRASLEKANDELAALQAQRGAVSGQVQTFTVTSGSALSPAYTTVAEIFKTSPDMVSAAFSLIMSIILELILYGSGQFGFMLWKLRNKHVFKEADNDEIRDEESAMVPRSEMRRGQIVADNDGHILSGAGPAMSFCSACGESLDSGRCPNNVQDRRQPTTAKATPTAKPQERVVRGFSGGIEADVPRAEVKPDTQSVTQPLNATVTQPLNATVNTGLGNGVCEHCSATYKRVVDWQRFCCEEHKLAFHGFVPGKRGIKSRKQKPAK